MVITIVETAMVVTIVETTMVMTIIETTMVITIVDTTMVITTVEQCFWDCPWTEHLEIYNPLDQKNCGAMQNTILFKQKNSEYFAASLKDTDQKRNINRK